MNEGLGELRVSQTLFCRKKNIFYQIVFTFAGKKRYNTTR